MTSLWTLMNAKLDSITTIVTKIFDLITLGMNKFIQFRSQMGTIKGYAKKDVEKLTAKEEEAPAGPESDSEDTEGKEKE